MGDFQIQYDAALDAARKHEQAADDVAEVEPTMPDSVDGGDGGDFIMNAMAAVALAAGEVIQVNEAAAARLRTTVNRTRGIDEAAEEDFRVMWEAGLLDG